MICLFILPALCASHTKGRMFGSTAIGSRCRFARISWHSIEKSQSLTVTVPRTPFHTFPETLPIHLNEFRDWHLSGLKGALCNGNRVHSYTAHSHLGSTLISSVRLFVAQLVPNYPFPVNSAMLTSVDAISYYVDIRIALPRTEAAWLCLKHDTVCPLGTEDGSI